MQQTVNEESTRSPKKKAASSIPIRAYFMACARNWYWFVISIIACTCIAFLYGKSQPKLYSAKTQIMLKTKDTNAGTQSQVFSDLGINSGNNVMANEEFRLRSTDLLESVAKNLGVNIQYYGHVFLRDVNIYTSSPIEITPLREITTPFTITVVPKGGNDFEFKVGEEGWKKAHFGNKVSTAYGPIAITKNKNYNDKHYTDFQVIVKVNTPRALATRIKSQLTTECPNKFSDVLNVSLTTPTRRVTS